MRLVSQLTLSAVVALGGLAFASSANAQALIVGTADIQDKVFEFQLPNTGGTATLLTPTSRRPRGIDYDRVLDDLYVTSGPDPGQPQSPYITVYDSAGNFKRQVVAQSNSGSGNTDIKNLNDCDYHNGKLYVDNAYVYNGSGSGDRNIYVYNDPQGFSGPAVPFATLSAAVDPQSDIWFNGIEFSGQDGNLYAVQQTGSGGGGTGYIRRFDGTTGAYIDTISNGTHTNMFGLTFDPKGNLYYGVGNNIYTEAFTGLDGFGNATYGADTLLTPTGLATNMICDVFFASDNYLYAAGLDGSSLFKVDPSNGAVLNSIGNGLGAPKNDFITEVFPATPDVPEPSSVAFGVIAFGSVLGLIARKRKA